MIEFSAEVSSEEVSAALRKLLRGLKDLTPVMDTIGLELQGRISDRFETETDPEGHAWAPWAPSTAASYPADGNGRILDRYGTAGMLGSLNHRPGRDSVGVGFSAVASKAGDVYAIYHEMGTRTMPRRGLLFADPEEGTLSDGDEEAVLDILERYLSDLAA